MRKVLHFVKVATLVYMLFWVVFIGIVVIAQIGGSL